jgi:hypothetical protein
VNEHLGLDLVTDVGTKGHAVFSPCRTYRYRLTRELDGRRPLVICGLNPSTATAELNDATIRRELGFAKRWGCGRLVKVNAYAFRATDPKVMLRAAKTGVDIVGPENDRCIVDAIRDAMVADGIILAAWGANIDPVRQAALSLMLSVRTMTNSFPVCLGVNKDGSPVHPLYVPYDREPVPWRCP